MRRMADQVGFDEDLGGGCGFFAVETPALAKRSITALPRRPTS